VDESEQRQVNTEDSSESNTESTDGNYDCLLSCSMTLCALFKRRRQLQTGGYRWIVSL